MNWKPKPMSESENRELEKHAKTEREQERDGDRIPLRVLVRLRVTHGLSQYDLAHATGIAQPNIAAMERGQRPLTPEMWECINTELQTWLAAREEAAERAVQAAWNKPHLVAMRANLEQETI